MTQNTAIRTGDFCWVELATTAPAAARDFYSKLFGWEIYGGDHDSAEMRYDHLKVEDREIGGLYELQGEQKQAGIPPHWNNYILSDKLEDSMAKVKELGGNVHAGPIEVGENGRLAICQDTTGAMFCFWEAGSHIGGGFQGAPGEPCWWELMTRDTAIARAFYEGLGWTAVESPMPDGMVYTVFSNGGRPICGMMEMGDEFAEVPPRWMTYFASVDADATVATLKEHGGAVHVPVTEFPDMGRFAMLADPQGAAFGIYEGAGDCGE